MHGYHVEVIDSTGSVSVGRETDNGRSAFIRVIHELYSIRDNNKVNRSALSLKHLLMCCIDKGFFGSIFLSGI